MPINLKINRKKSRKNGLKTKNGIRLSNIKTFFKESIFDIVIKIGTA